jgi:plasmid stabilization system protein ParE
MTYRYHLAALLELDEAIEFYEGRQAGLGQEFAAAVRNAVERIVDSPDAWPQVRPGVRRCLLRRFPYGLLYGEADGAIIIVAVMHLRRRTDYWIDRLE